MGLLSISLVSSWFAVALSLERPLLTKPPTPSWRTPVYEDEQLALYCSVKNAVPSSMRWTVDGQNISHSNHFLLEDGNQTLVIPDPTPDDSAIYACHAYNEAGSDMYSEIITILNRQTVVAPRVVCTIPTNQLAFVKIGMDSVLISCTIYAGNPSLSEFNLEKNWVKNGMKLDDNPKHTMGFRDTEKGQVFSLEIHNITNEDLGDYQCIGENKFGNDSRVIEVRLPVPTEDGLPTWAIGVVTGIVVLLFCGSVILITILRKRSETELEWKKPDSAGFEDPDRELIYDVFVSYSSDDLNWVKGTLFWKLRDKGYAICIDFKDFHGGQTIERNIVESIYKSRKTVVVMSSNFLRSFWGQYELQQAHNKALLKREDTLVLVKLDDCNIPAVWLGKTFLDNTNPDVKPHFWTRLFTSIGEPEGFKQDDDWINDDERDLEPQPLII